ncbi:MAG: class A sortase [Streptococcaceae bacterium]|jgi:sortase A|nr:class A sortase [Streptococcaceae bacterium]
MKKIFLTLRRILVIAFVAELLTIGVIAIFNKSATSHLLQQQASAIQMDKFSVQDIRKAQKANVKNDANSAIKPLSMQELLASRLSQSPYIPIGAVAVPEVNLSLPILKGTTNDHLLYGASTYFLDRKLGEGNTVLFGHYIYTDMTAIFSPLKNAQKGMKVYLTDAQNIYTYKITKTVSVEPTSWTLLDQAPKGKNWITMVLCDDMYGKKRFVVQGELIKTTKGLDKASKEEYSAFEQQFNEWNI